MSDKKPELSDAMKKKVEPRVFTKNPIQGTKFTIAISSAKGGVGKSTFATNLALALKKKIFLFRDDFRNCSDSNEYPLNLMIFLGLPKENWQEYYLESLEDITSNKKEFLNWSQN